MAGLLGQSQQKPQEELIFQPMRAFDLTEMPKGLLNNFEGGPIAAHYALQDYGDQSKYGIQFAVLIKFRTEDGDEGEEWYPAGDLRYFRPGLPGSPTPIALPAGYYDDKLKKYFIPELASATREQLDAYSGDVCFAAVRNGKQMIFGENKKFGQLLKKAAVEGWPYDGRLLFQSVSACLRTMYGKWDRVASKSGGKDAAVPEGLGAEGAVEKKSNTSQTLLLTQYVPPPAAWLAQLSGAAPMPQGGVIAGTLMTMSPTAIAPPFQAAQPIAQPAPPQAAATLDALVPQLATIALATHPKGSPVPHNIIAMAVMQGAKDHGADPAMAWMAFADKNKLAVWAQAYGWVYDPAGNTLTIRG
jgi:hypothetical protein